MLSSISVSPTFEPALKMSLLNYVHTLTLKGIPASLASFSSFPNLGGLSEPVPDPPVRFLLGVGKSLGRLLLTEVGPLHPS